MGMKRSQIDNTRLDAIGKQLIIQGLVSAKDIDLITDKPTIFDGVLKRIAATSPIVKTRVSSRRRYIPAFAGLAIVFAAITFGVIQKNSVQPTTDVRTNLDPADVPVEARPDTFPPLRAGSNPTSDRASIPNVSRPRFETMSAGLKSATPKPQRPEYRESDGDFYAISYEGDVADASRGGRIVRVDMPRSSLFAMGVNVPLENDSETVKADLLVGPDGVTRAIRVVR